ncbi:MAG: ABC transporter ATP-binding protein [Bacilli bacterium]
MLKVKNLRVTYNGSIKALQGVDIEVKKGEIVVLIGANGAGKTTLLRTLSGLETAEPESQALLDLKELTDKRTLNRLAGKRITDKLLAAYTESDIAIDKITSTEDISKEICGRSTPYTRYKVKRLRVRYKKYIKTDLLKIKPYNIMNYGIAHVPEGRQVFYNLTVEENLEMGAYKRNNKKKVHEDLEHVYVLFPRLKERRKQKAGTLSGGEQQMLAVGRALMGKPKMLLLDEPSMGLAPIIVSDIFSIIKKLNEEGITILLVEQNAKAALSIADRAYVIANGKIVLTGTGKELLQDERVKSAYLGS